MVYELGPLNIQLSSVQWLAAFWTFSVLLAFNLAYVLFLYDRVQSDVTRARKLMTVFIGSLIVVGTYAHTLASKPFSLNDCILLALVAVHGWMAEDLVQSFMEKATRTRPEPPKASQ